MKRAVVLFGAGASIEYGAPSTSKLTATVQQQVEADDWLKNIGGDKIYAKIKAGLEGYLRHPGLISFEHIYHCVHELIYVSEPPDWTLDEFRPLLYPFLGRKIDAGENILLSLARKIVQVILVEVSMCCENSKFKLDPLAKFIGQLRHDHVTRIYTTNYDDFPLQAMPNLYLLNPER